MNRHERRLVLQQVKNNATDTLKLFNKTAIRYHEELTHLLHSNESITGIVIADAGTNDSISAREWIGLLKAFQALQNITHLQIESSIDCMIASTMIWQLRSLSALILQDVDWRESSWKCFAAALRNHPSLTVFHLIQEKQGSVVCIDDVGLALASAPKMRWYRHTNRTSSVGPLLSECVVSKLVRSKSLKALECSGGGFHDDSAWIRLAESLSSSSLETLVLANNNLTAHQLSILLDQLQHNSTLGFLDVCNNPVRVACCPNPSTFLFMDRLSDVPGVALDNLWSMSRQHGNLLVSMEMIGLKTLQPAVVSMLAPLARQDNDSLSKRNNMASPWRRRCARSPRSIVPMEGVEDEPIRLE